MKEDPYVDPLVAANELVGFILDNERNNHQLKQLSACLDKFVYSLRFLLVDNVAEIQNTEDEPPRKGDRELREAIEPSFPDLGFYWTVLDSRIGHTEHVETGAGDAIDDLIDIAKELAEVQWYFDHHGRNEALAALRWKYENHLCTHVIPLRAHLEELILPFLSRE